jgi:16S rRNA (adenine1518-N6/adenine1519-N6)-dimethyltransferase
MSLPPRRRWGQNFLVDRSAARRIVEAAGTLSGSIPLEIGPGRGALTEALLERVERLVVVEIDPGLAERLRARFSRERLVVIETDVLTLDWDRVAIEAGAPASRPIAVIGNLPYNISKPFLMRMVGQRAKVDRAVLTLQREVVDRVVARPGGRDYGALGILTGAAYRVERLFDLAPGAFRPRPKVVSSVTRWEPRPREDLPEAVELALRACLKASFARRRRTLFNNLRAALDGDEVRVAALLHNARIDGSLRPEAVPPEGYRRLAEAWRREGVGPPPGA